MRFFITLANSGSMKSARKKRNAFCALRNVSRLAYSFGPQAWSGVVFDTIIADG